uniref:Uncharacterized protein n=1 Tax=Mucochytrium quahogii TaxID=96639 RepID=A0A7S2R7Y4_9STRA|mmetsp:Transcript_27157/g.43634  ORF Transcript_27157/g.43634 Transcript_27157/m.43634 type:complete len:538 (+) Transcript_27157:1143-2756(+)|eukprot:CAMPEP_0203759754 /NCGR_PEP_ID=MMETSP0098-20131031/12914_1 /ASSEMBLY_ACC=CAM_ASM_000208 /TAXON_ID=96639 /ORGANISM=" , Strain NY0313808BC1" /LENGTH=537 /DNA_ID=CAMNT_0050652923 /DNA_START=513 /DNA_END=2126 /DNA_ORIENTATION=-
MGWDTKSVLSTGAAILVSAAVFVGTIYVMNDVVSKAQKKKVASNDHQRDDKPKKASKNVENAQVPSNPKSVDDLLKQDEDEVRRALMRKLMSDSKFQIKEKKGGMNQVEDKMKSIMKKAMWDMIEIDVKSQDYRKLKAVMYELKGRIANLTPSRKDLLQQLDEVLDIGLITQQLENQAPEQWNLHPFAQYVVGWIRNLESPGRNADTDAWMKSYFQKLEAPDRDTFKLLRELFDYSHEKLDLIQIDTTNVLIRSLAPVVSEHGVEYARAQFDEHVKSGKVSLEKTQAWAAMAIELTNSTDCSINQYHRRGVIELVLPGGVYHLESADVLDEDPYGGKLPETLQDEKTKLVELIYFAQSLWRIAYMIMRIRQVVPGTTNEMLDEVRELLSAPMERFIVEDSVGNSGTDCIKVTKIGRKSYEKLVCEAVIKSVKKYQPLEEVDEKTLRDLISKAFALSVNHEPTFKLINTRLRQIILDLVVPAPETRKKNFQKLPQELGSLRLRPLQDNVIQLLEELMQLADRDFSIHSQRYSAMFKQD